MRGPFEPCPPVFIPRCCDDRGVRAFVEAELLNFLTDCPKLTPRETFAAARKAFGDARCVDLEITVH